MSGPPSGSLDSLPAVLPARTGPVRPFADLLAAELASVPGSMEREHVALLARCAVRMQLDDEACQAAASTMRQAPGSIERSLGRIALPDGLPLWLEYPHTPRLAAYDRGFEDGKAGELPDRVACLLAPDPSNPSHIAGFVCWCLGNGRIMQSYAMLHWDLTQMAQAALRAPRRGDEGSESRLLELGSAVVPPGFCSEIEVLLGNPGPGSRYEQAMQHTRRDTLGEHLFLLSALLLTASSAVDMELTCGTPPGTQNQDDEEPATWLVHIDKTRSPLQRMGFRPPPGFSEPWFRGPLRWNRPTPADPASATI